MKRTVLALLLVLLVATPCFAQEIEPDGIFSIEGTRWRSCGISSSIQFGLGGSGSGFNFNIGCSGNSYEFYEGKIYSCSSSGYCSPLPTSFYIDTPLVGIGLAVPFTHIGLDLLIMQPTGFGVYTSLYWGMRWGFGTGILFKLGLPKFGSISPDIGIQEITMPGVTVKCLNTTFTDGYVDLQFSPPEGLTFSNISIQSNIEIEFDLEIAVDAPLGQKSVIVTYGSPSKSVTGMAVFEVLDITNF